MRRRIGLFVVVGLMAPLAMAAQASAQGATLQVNVPSARPGQVITVTGTGYAGSNNHIEGDVNLRLSTRESEPLATTNVTGQGTISATFPIPGSLTPGEHLLIATQVSKTGRHLFGVPGRTKLRVAAAGAVGPPRGGPPGEIPPAALVGTILALLALTGAVVFRVRRLRTLAGRTQPNFSR